MHPGESVFLYDPTQLGCFNVSSPFDTNLQGSQYRLSLVVRQTSIQLVHISNQSALINVYVVDYHGKAKYLSCLHYDCSSVGHTGLTFISEPNTTKVGEGKDVRFDCIYIGTHAHPLWNITYSDGTSRLMSTTRLPPKHFLRDTGIAILDVDETMNMTSYSCLFQVYNRNEVVFVSSRVGTLIVLQTIVFSLRFAASIDNQLSLLEGDYPLEVLIIKEGYSANTFVVILTIEKFEGNESKNYYNNLYDDL